MNVMPGPRCVVVGVDGSPNSIAALRHAAAEAHRRNAVLDVIRVLDPDSGRPHPVRAVVAWLRLRRLAAREIPRSQPLTARLRVPTGVPGRVLTTASRRAELVVIGARDHSQAHNPLGGDTVPHVLERSACEVVICADHAENRRTT